MCEQVSVSLPYRGHSHDLYERGHCQASFHFTRILLFDLKSLFFRPDLTSAERGAQDLSRTGGGSTRPEGLSLIDRAPRASLRYERVVLSDCLSLN